MLGHTLWVADIAWSPDGKLIASGSGNGTLVVWEAATGKEITSLRLEGGGVTTVGWSPDGKYLATGHAAPTDRIRIWDVSSISNTVQAATQTTQATAVPSWQPIHKMSPTGSVESVVWSPDSKLLAVGMGFVNPNRKIGIRESGVVIYDTVTGGVRATLPYPDDVLDLIWSSNGKHLAFRASSPEITPQNPLGLGHIIVWTLSSDSETMAEDKGTENNAEGNGASPPSSGQSMTAPGSTLMLDELEGLSGLDWSPDGKMLAAQGGNDLKLLDTSGDDPSAWNEIGIITSYSDGVGHVRWSPDGKSVAVGGSPTVDVWDVQSKKKTHTFPHFDAVNSIDWSPDSKLLATGSEDHYVRLWDVK